MPFWRPITISHETCLKDEICSWQMILQVRKQQSSLRFQYNFSRKLLRGHQHICRSNNIFAPFQTTVQFLFLSPATWRCQEWDSVSFHGGSFGIRAMCIFFAVMRESWTKLFYQNICCRHYKNIYMYYACSRSWDVSKEAWPVGAILFFLLFLLISS